MPRIPQRPEEVTRQFASDYQTLFGDDLISVILYGSGARGEYIPQKSDLNFLVVLTEGAMARLKEAFPLIHKWRNSRVNIPLFLTEDYISSSLDMFPVEFLNLRESHTLVFGKNVLKDLPFDSERMRLQIERELKGKLLLLRGSYLDSEGKPKELEHLLTVSLTAFLSLFRALLFLKGREVPRSHEDLISAAATETGFDKKPFKEVLRIKKGQAKFPRDTLLGIAEKYLHEVGILCRIVDQQKFREGDV